MHDDDHIPEQCDVPQEKIAINNWVFVGVDSYVPEVKETNNSYPLMYALFFLFLTFKCEIRKILYK